MLLVRDLERRVLLMKRPADGIWGGLYSLPELVDGEDPGSWCDEHLGAAVDGETPMPRVDHTFTHFDLTIQPLLIHLASPPRAVMDREEWLWYNPAHEIRVGVASPITTLLQSLRNPQEPLL